MKAVMSFILVAICAIAADAIGYGYALYLGYSQKPIVIDPDLGTLQTFRGARGFFSDAAGYQLRDNVPLVLLGDSVTRASHIENDAETFPGLLGGVNAGMDGYDSYQLSTLYANRIANAQPAVVGLMVSIDDFIPPHLSQVLAARKPKIWTGFNGDFLNWTRFLVDYGREFDQEVKPLNGEDVADFKLRMESLIEGREEVDDLTLDAWGRAVATIKSKSTGAFFVAVLPPSVHVDDWIRKKRVSPIYSQVQAWCETNGVKFVDLMPAFEVIDYRDTYFSHFNLTPYGHKRIAATISRSLQAEFALSFGEREVGSL